jgi:hypothetical protein
MHYLKKLILSCLLTLVSLSVFSQNTITWYRVTSDSSNLNYNPFVGNTIKTSYYNINPKTGEQKRYIGNSIWVVDSLFAQKSTPVTSNSISLDYSPEQFGAVNSNITFAQKGIDQTTVDLTYPGIGANTSDNIDWAAWQMAVKMATTNGGSVKAKGGIYYIGSKPIYIEKYAKNFQIDGNYCKVISTSPSSIFTRISPSSNSDAQTMVELKLTFKNITLRGNSSQIGIDFGPSYGAVYENIIGENLMECIHLRFALRTIISNCFSTNSNIGWVADKGNWSGASNSNSQSNHTTFTSCRYFGAGDCAFKIIASSGCVVENCIIEGQSVRAGIDFDGNGSTVVKDFSVRNIHFECTGGASESIIKIRMHSGIATVDKVYAIYSSILVDAGATTGYLTMRVSNVSYCVLKNGKAFNNAGNVGWILEYNENPLTTNSASTTVPTWFNGTAVSLCNGSGCGSNRFYYIGIPR